MAIRQAVPGIQSLLWIGGRVDEIEKRFGSACDNRFYGFEQIQLHLENRPDTQPGEWPMPGRVATLDCLVDAAAL
ncbi:MAG: hypothetical protein PHV34_01960 [Verrucomicrobiae bacterium]|nr:hypothetical protein [Verrucomicrobiae bacterium]